MDEWMERDESQAQEGSKRNVASSEESVEEGLRRRIEALEIENRRLKLDLDALQGKKGSNPTFGKDVGSVEDRRISFAMDACVSPSREGFEGKDLSADEIERFSRQLVLPSFGVQKQKELLRSSALIIGAGGLGCPAALYLAACGIGRLGIADKDHVELNNLHRQIAHSERRLGWHKAHSAARACQDITARLQVELYTDGVRRDNILSTIEKYDVILDCSDNAGTRYLINDACVVANKPLVSGAAIGLEGQLTVYHHGDKGPCYRCLFPESPKPEACQRCSDAGVLGVVPGIIGCLQALEGIKIITGLGTPLSRRLLLFNASSLDFTCVKLRERSTSCICCGDSPALDACTLETYDYEAFTGASYTDKAPHLDPIIPPRYRVTAQQYNERRYLSTHELWDVRPVHEYDIVSLPRSKNVPLECICSATQALLERNDKIDVFVVCRRGNDSQLAVNAMRKMGIETCYDIVDGLEGWRREVDAGFPLY